MLEWLFFSFVNTSMTSMRGESEKQAQFFLVDCKNLFHVQENYYYYVLKNSITFKHARYIVLVI